MDRQFYYNAVKYLAHMAYFSEEESQKIAVISQFIEDYDKSTNIYVSRSELTDEIIKRNLYTEKTEPMKEPKFYVTLPKTQISNNIKLPLDYKFEEHESELFMAFHYMPEFKLSEIQKIENVIDREYAYQTTPIYYEYKHNVIDELKNKALYLYNKGNGDREAALIYIGAVAHIIADSFAHNKMVGIKSYLAEMDVLEAKDTVSFKDFTQMYTPENFKNFLKVGHASIGDLTNKYGLSATIYQLNEVSGYNSFTLKPKQRAIDAADSIYKFFRECKGLSHESGNETVFKNTISPTIDMLLKYNLTAIDSEWSTLTGHEYNYDYSEAIDMICDNNNDVCNFAIMVDDVLKALKEKDQPVSILGLHNNEPEKPTKPEMTISPITYNQNDIIIKMESKYPEEQEHIYFEYRLLDGYKIVGSNRLDFSNTDYASDAVNLKIPEITRDYDLTLRTDISGDFKNNNIVTRKFKIFGKRGICKIESVYTNKGKDIITVYNDMLSEGNICYPFNAPYTDTDGYKKLDILLNAALSVQIEGGLICKQIKKCGLTLFNPATGEHIKHINNPKFNKYEITNGGTKLYLCFDEFWKNSIDTTKYKNNIANYILGLEIEGVVADTTQGIAGKPQINFTWNSNDYIGTGNQFEVEFKW